MHRILNKSNPYIYLSDTKNSVFHREIETVVGLLETFSLPVKQCPTHTCIMARICLQASHVITLDWHPDSLISPIIHFWDIQGWGVRDFCPLPAATLPKLEDRLVEQWQHILLGYVHTQASSKQEQ